MAVVPTDEVLTILAVEDLPGTFDLVVGVGEVPYQANRRAMIELDMKGNTKKGMAKARAALAGIDAFVNELESLGYASRNIAETAASVLRPAGNRP